MVSSSNSASSPHEMTALQARTSFSPARTRGRTTRQIIGSDNDVLVSSVLLSKCFSTCEGWNPSEEIQTCPIPWSSTANAEICSCPLSLNVWLVTCDHRDLSYTGLVSQRSHLSSFHHGNAHSWTPRPFPNLRGVIDVNNPEKIVWPQRARLQYP